MSDPFLGEIRMFGGNYAPRFWAMCDGQKLVISQNEALYSLLTTMYGGNGVTDFALPDMRGRLPMHHGQGPGLTNRYLGYRFGFEQAHLTLNQIPAHNHPMVGSDDEATSNDPGARVFARTLDKFYDDGSQENLKQSLAPDTIQPSGGSQPHSNLMPFYCITFIIALVGAYPPRS
jgi:microcystin-dependent protein